MSDVLGSKVNNLGLALGMPLKFYSSVANVLKLKTRKYWGLIHTFGEVTGQKLVDSPLPIPHPRYWESLHSGKNSQTVKFNKQPINSVGILTY